MSKSQSLTTNSRISPWLARLLYPLGCYVVIPGFFGKIEITGQENIPTKNPVIVAPTHRSRWDALLVPYAVGRMVSGRDLRFMVSADEAKGLQYWFISRMGGFPIDPKRPGVSSVRHSVELLQNDEMLVIFPEGGIVRERKVYSLKRGVARIALDVAVDRPGTEVNILPVSLKYSDPYPSWGADVKIEIGVPLNAAEYLEESVRRSSQKLTAALETQLRELHELPQSKEILV
ncbi:Phospholipid/glycerol acyltransferase [Hyella patelloides LEGE 07179]|uniref:Phospholipid/glycerol acyltransferase n=1 Tax=Hyella patelloides LEGE 07179 TaxID=945734 RepID=A0A563W0K5_9CYAN|nr:1-acyl-sn-glycerol-3-phosphate acyltransferase [Hyella patelloides]VEP17211.1 Phospholipid/glycerol acyltransferase [Hyella patelloides LEGE 07179]